MHALENSTERPVLKKMRCGHFVVIHDFDTHNYIRCELTNTAIFLVGPYDLAGDKNMFCAKNRGERIKEGYSSCTA